MTPKISPSDSVERANLPAPTAPAPAPPGKIVADIPKVRIKSYARGGKGSRMIKCHKHAGIYPPATFPTLDCAPVRDLPPIPSVISASSEFRPIEQASHKFQIVSTWTQRMDMLDVTSPRIPLLSVRYRLEAEGKDVSLIEYASAATSCHHERATRTQRPRVLVVITRSIGTLRIRL